MKTGKKLLSFFLAVVMAVTACSVGFTAFAKSSSSDLFTQPKDANETYDSLVNSIYDYLPDILGLIDSAIKKSDPTSKGLIDKGIDISKIKEADKPFYELMVEVSPMIIGLISSKGDQDKVLEDFATYYGKQYGDKPNITLMQKTYCLDFLKDDKAAMSFYALYQFCLDNLSNSDSKISSYAKKTLQDLRDNLKPLGDAVTKIGNGEFDYQTALDNLFDNLYKEDGTTKIDDANDYIQSATCEYEISKLKVKVGTELVSINDALKYSEYSSLSGLIDRVGAYLGDSCVGYNDLSQSLFDFYGPGAVALEVVTYLQLIETSGSNIVYDGKTITSKNYLSVMPTISDFSKETLNGPLADYPDQKTYDSVYELNLSNALYPILGLDDQDNLDKSTYFFDASKGLIVKSGLYGNLDAVNKLIKNESTSTADFDTIKKYIADNNITTKESFKDYVTGDKSPFSTSIKRYVTYFGGIGSNQGFQNMLNNIKAGNYSDYVEKFNKEIANSLATSSFGTSNALPSSFNLNCEAIYLDYIETTKITKVMIDKDAKQYKYSDYAPDDSIVLSVVNSAINGYLQYINPSNPNKLNIAGMEIDLVKTVDDVLKNFLGDDTKITCKVLYDNLYDIYIRLAEKPVDTLLELMPLLSTIVDKAVVPLIFTDDNSVKDLPFQLYGILCGESGPLYKFTQESEKANGVADSKKGAVGIGQLNFDLNYILPSLLNYMKGDASYIKSYYKSDSTSNVQYDGSVPVITNIYIADKWIKENLYNMEFTNANKTTTDAKGNTVIVKDNKGNPEKKYATGVKEILTKVVSSASTSTTQLYWGKYKSGQTATTCLDKGANNLTNALPELISTLGQTLKNDFNVSTDWTYGKSFTNATTGVVSYGSADKDNDDTFLNKLESMYENPKAADIFDELSNFLVQDLLDAVIDLFNDVFTSDNDISKNIPIVTGVVNALGGFGEKSIVTDVLNGVFQLTRESKCSFTLSKQSNGYVGFNIMSGYFLIANIKPIINVVKETIANTNADKEAAKKANTSSLTSAFAASILSANPTESNSASLASTNNVLNKNNIKASKNTIAALDDVLSDLLSNTYINGYKTDSTDGLISGLVKLASNYIGNDNAKPALQLINSYTYYLSDGKAADAKGNVKDKEIYTDKNLSNLVVQTYALLENVVETLLRSTWNDSKKTGSHKFNISLNDINNKKCNYNVITEAIEGAISPDSVSMHMSGYDDVAKQLQSYQCWHKMLSLKKTTSANKLNKNLSNNIGNTTVTLKYGIAAGDKEAFYGALSESFGIITSMVSVLFVDAGLYKSTIYPIVSKLLSKVDEKGTTFTGDALAVCNSVYAPEELLKGDKKTALFAIIRPIGTLLDAFYAQPATVLVELLQGVATLLDDTNYPNLHKIILDTLKPIDNEISGVGKIVGVFSKTYCNRISGIKISNIINKAVQSAIDKNDKGIKLHFDITKFRGSSLITTANAIIKPYGLKLKQCNYNQISKAQTPQALLLILSYVIDNVMSNIKGIAKLFDFNVSGSSSSLKELINALTSLTAADILAAITTIISVVKNPTEIYWTFYQYVMEKVYNFKYPLGITMSEADNAVDQLDSLVSNVFPLLNSLGVTDISGLSSLVNDNLYTNKMLTTIATKLYGAMQGDVSKYLKSAGIDTTTKGVAKLLKNSSYGTTYSSAAATISKASSWKSIKTINWGFKDGSSSAKQGFAKGVAAIFRPFNELLTVFLADGSINTGNIIYNVVRSLNISTKAVTLKSGVLTIKVKGTDKKSANSIIKMNLNPVLNDLKKYGKITGHNGYEAAIVPLLEAFNAPNIKSYRAYKSDCKKAKDNVLIDVLNPLLGFVTKVCEAPFDTLTSVLPNVSYFIDNGGLTQFVTKLIGVDLEYNNIIKVQDYIIPLVNTLLQSKGIKISNIDWSYLAGLGTVKTVKSAAKNSAGSYTRKAITNANQGQVLITVLRYVLDNVLNNMSTIKTLLAKLKMSSTVKKVINSVLSQLGTATSDEVIIAVFYFLTEEPTNSFWNYSGYTSKNYSFSYPKGLDIDFVKNLGPMIDGLVSSLLDLNKTVGKLIYKDDIINKLASLIYTNIEKVKIADGLYLDDLLAQTGIDFTTANVASLLNNSKYGKTYPAAASTISSSSSWSKVNFDNVKWNVTNRDSFLHALCAILRPAYGVLDVLLNDGSLGLFSLISVPGSNGYTSSLVPLMEAFGLYNVKTQYQYRKDIAASYDNILLDVLNPLMDKVEDILYAPLQTLTSMIPNLAFFFANDGLLQFIDNLVTPVTALLNAVKPIVDVNALLNTLGVKLKGKSLDLYHISSIVEPYIGKDNVVPMLNSLLGGIDIKGKKLGVKLNDIDWFQLASHGTVVTTGISQAATIGSRVYVDADSSATLIAVLRYLINTIQTGDNLNQIKNLISGLVGSANSTVSDVVGTVLKMFMEYKGDDLIAQLAELLQTLAS